MIPESWRAGEVAVVGLGRSGVAATRLLVHAGVAVYASDAASPAVPADVGRLPRVTVELGRHDLARIRRARAVVVSPGVPPTAPPLAAAREARVPIVAELDLGFQALERQHVIAVTGTNGKTTTTALTAHLLETGGVAVAAAGNIGRPLSDVAASEERPAWLVVEVSSFQLHDSPHFAPAVGVLTNLAPDHLDRYASVADYYADKRLLFRNAAPDSIWVLNGDDPTAQDLARGVPGRSRLFSVERRADGWFDRSARTLRIGDASLVARDELQLLGDHNVANALAASLAAETAGVALGDVARALRTFRALPHRLELVREVGGVRWVNDSKATNVASTAVAIAAMDRPFVILLGGRHKGEPYTRLGPLLAARCRLVIAFGEAGPLVRRDLDGAVPVADASDFADVVRRARAAARPGDAVLLSPACSSYDMFTNYEERGATFRGLVEAF
ncbi:MAG TPA: UDP-N-acetylmuramoyl-L-alanine--D-glutamate ligase [Gemmatimonadales bacterium]|nr:UDP-N-acetylmuramoyl-L-alanine--D-glutamate ligase [Gemmatimonadales bacterium]